MAAITTAVGVGVSTETEKGPQDYITLYVFSEQVYAQFSGLEDHDISDFSKLQAKFGLDLSETIFKGYIQ